MRKLLPLLSLLFPLAAYATQEGPDIHAACEDPAPVQFSYIPEVFGAVKAKFEFSTYDGDHRFNVRNTRLGAKGYVSPNIRYMMQIDFNNEGSIAVLDALAAYQIGHLEVSLGQQQYKFSSDLDRGPNTNLFANRSFLAKYLTTFYGKNNNGGAYVRNIGSRDLGVLASYKIDTRVPVTLRLGAFNGSGANNPDWQNNINVVARAEIGGEGGLGGAVAHYNGRAGMVSDYEFIADASRQPYSYRPKIRMWAGELHYAGNNYRIEAEYAQRRLRDYDDGLHLLQAAHIQGYYQFAVGNNKGGVKYIAPVGRWDYGRNIEFVNELDGSLDHLTANRATVGVNFGFSHRIIVAELRLNYEKYIFSGTPADLNVNRLFQDKFSIEIVVSF